MDESRRSRLPQSLDLAAEDPLPIATRTSMRDSDQTRIPNRDSHAVKVPDRSSHGYVYAAGKLRAVNDAVSTYRSPERRLGERCIALFSELRQCYASLSSLLHQTFVVRRGQRLIRSL